MLNRLEKSIWKRIFYRIIIENNILIEFFNRIFRIKVKKVGLIFYVVLI